MTEETTVKQIIVGYGAHPHSALALGWAAALAKRVNAHVTVASVYAPGYAEMSTDDYQRHLAQREQEVTDILQRVGHADVDAVTFDGEGASDLLNYAEEHGADLIVVGHHDAHGPGGFGENGASETLLRHSSIPFVAVGHDGTYRLPSDDPVTIVVGIDGSLANEAAVDWIAGLAAELGAATVPVLSVNTGASTSRGHHGTHLLDEKAAAEVAARLPGRPSLENINEAPVTGLLDAAKEHDAAMIAIGTRGHFSLDDLFSGQITRHVIHRSDRPVLVVPHPSHD
ncbi:MAG: universal stress protein [Acidimicrobiales bacterium]